MGSGNEETRTQFLCLILDNEFSPNFLLFDPAPNITSYHTHSTAQVAEIVGPRRFSLTWRSSFLIAQRSPSPPSFPPPTPLSGTVKCASHVSPGA